MAIASLLAWVPLHRREPSRVVIVTTRETTSCAGQAIEAAYRNLPDKGCLLLDMASTEVYDEELLNVLIMAFRHISSHKGCFGIIPSEHLRAKLEVLGLLQVPGFQVFDNIDQALSMMH